MRALIQRVSAASVQVDGTVIGQIGPGLVILVCAMAGDTTAQAEQLAAKIAKLRIFRDEAGKMNRSLLDTGGATLVVSQFTLAADTSRGNRPGFSAAAARAHLQSPFAEAGDAFMLSDPNGHLDGIEGAQLHYAPAFGI